MPKKVLITGGLGYIGMELSLLLSGESRKNNIKVLDTSFFSERVSQLKRWGIDYSQVDILDSHKLEEELKNVDVVYHLAGITNVGRTIEDIDRKRDKLIRDVGVEGTRNIIKFCPSSRLKVWNYLMSKIRIRTGYIENKVYYHFYTQFCKVR